MMYQIMDEVPDMNGGTRHEWRYQTLIGYQIVDGIPDSRSNTRLWIEYQLGVGY